MNDIVENEAPQKPLCLNCDEKMPRKATFCPHCGQRNNKGKVSMKELLRRFWSNFSHLDSKFVKMCWQLLVPGKVTAEYFAGRQKRYPHPVQFFFVVMFFFLLLFSKSIGNSRNGNLHINSKSTGFNISAPKDSARQSEKLDFFESLQRYAQGRELRSAYDSLPLAWKTPTTRLAIDSVITRVNGRWERQITNIQSLTEDSTDTGTLDTIPLNFVNRQIKLSIIDVVELSPEEILEKYNIHNWQDRILVTQGIKSLKDSQSLMHTYTGNIGWTVLILIAFMALVLYVLYIRRKRYYVEHFVFLMHQNSGAFLLLTLGLLFKWLGWNIGVGGWFLLILWITIALLLAMKRFYGQGWPKTVAKWMIYCLLYGISFSLIFIISLLTAFLIF